MAATAVKEDLTSQPEMPFCKICRKEKEIRLKRFLIIYIIIIVILIIF